MISGLGCSSCHGSKFVEEGLAGILGEGLGIIINGVDGAYDAQGNFVPGMKTILESDTQAPVTINFIPGVGTSVSPTIAPAPTPTSSGLNPIGAQTYGTGEGVPPPSTATPNPQTQPQQQASVSGGGGTLAVPMASPNPFNLSHILLFGGIGLLALAFLGKGEE